MSDDNKRNIMFFESSSMRGLYEETDQWQVANRKRFHSVAIHKEDDVYCCIAFSNPTEVVLVDPVDNKAAFLTDRALHVIVR
jgi:hypothetical protein